MRKAWDPLTPKLSTPWLSLPIIPGLVHDEPGGALQQGQGGGLPHSLHTLTKPRKTKDARPLSAYPTRA